MPNWQNPSATEQLLFSTLRLETRDTGGEPTGSGTGFVLLHSRPKRPDELFLVTNRHVVEGASMVVAYMTDSGPDGTPSVGSVFWANVVSFGQWTPHPDPAVDLCALALSKQLTILSLVAKQNAYLPRLSSAVLAKEADLDALDVFTPVMFIGYPSGMYDETNYMPILRQGFTASHPGLDFSGKPQFLIDASVFPGSSGSPVFAYTQGINERITNYKLLGVISSVMTQTEEGDIEFEDIPTAIRPYVSLTRYLNLGVVLKAPLVQTLLDSCT